MERHKLNRDADRMGQRRWWQGCLHVGAHQVAVAVALAGGGAAREVHGEVAHGVVHVVGAPRRQAQVGALRVEAAAAVRSRRPLAAAARVVRRARACMTIIIELGP